MIMYHTLQRITKRATILPVVLLGAMCIWPLTNLAADDGMLEQPHITVVGEARREVVPNRIAWQVTVTTRGETVAAVAAAHTPEVQAALAFLVAAPVAQDDLKTAHMQLQQRWRHVGKMGRVSDGFEARTRIQFAIENFELYQNIWSGLSELSGVTVDSARFVTPNDPAIQDRLRLQALAAAKRKATAMASALDQELGRVLLIDEMVGGASRPQPHMATMRVAADESASVAPGTVDLAQRVRVIFALEER
jgi:uncharacterized protein YggE